jgi:hypothetical protein
MREVALSLVDWLGRCDLFAELSVANLQQLESSLKWRESPQNLAPLVNGSNT